jgi:hypothetical protein
LCNQIALYCELMTDSVIVSASNYCRKNHV